MRANPAVTIGWRVLWLVAAVAIPIRSDAAPAAPHSVAASFLSNRSETKAHPKPISSPRRTSSTTSRDEAACPARA